jgi:WD40 repeat protein
MKIDEDARRDFETARLSGRDDPLEDFLPPPETPHFRATLEELVLIELEFAWQRDFSPFPFETYLERFPALDTDATKARLAYQEFLARRRAGHALPLESFRERLEALGTHTPFPPPEEVGSRSPEPATVVATRPQPALRGVQPGEVLGHYELLMRIGRGGCAEVWTARDTELQRTVALKVPRVDMGGDEAFLQRFHREARSAAQLRHPGIVTVHEVGQHGGLPYIVSDYIEGPSLAEVLATSPPDPTQAVSWVAELARALHHAHTAGIVHRDVKPGNVLVGDGGQLLLTDFGLATNPQSEILLTQQGDVLGTPAYMSPEQARGQSQRADARTDVYALGVMLYEMLTGRLPFVGGAATVLHAVVSEDPIQVRRLSPAVPQDLETICHRAMARERNLRYPTAGDLADDLERYLQHRPIKARRRGVLGRLVLWCRRNSVLAGTLALSVLVIVSVSGVGLWRVLEERERYRVERDQARANLARALLGEARAHIQARDTGWWWIAMDRLREVAALEAPDADRAELRDLVIRCQGAGVPCFREDAGWHEDGGAVRVLACRSDGGEVAVATGDGTVRVRDLGTGTLVGTLPSRRRWVTSLAFHPSDGSLAVTYREGPVVLWQPATETQETLDLDEWVGALAYTPAGELLAGDSSGQVLRLGRGEPVVLGRHEDAITCLALGEQSVVTGSQDETVRVWCLPDGGELARWELPDPPRSLIVMPDGEVAFGSYEHFGFGLLRDTREPRQRLRSDLHQGQVWWVRGGRRGRILTSSDDGTVRCWDQRFRELAVARSDAGPATALAAHPTEDLVVAGYADGQVRRWMLREPEARRVWYTEHRGVFLPDTHLLVTGRGVFDLDHMRDGDRGVPFDLPAVTDLIELPETGDVLVLQESGALERCSLAAGPQDTVPSSIPELTWLEPQRTWQAVDPRGQLEVLGTRSSGEIRDLRRGELVAELRAAGVTTASFVADGDELLLGTEARLVWRLPRAALHPADGAPVRPQQLLLPGGHLDRVWGLAASPTGEWIATTSHDGAVKLWDTMTFAHQRELSGGGDIAWSAAFSPDGKRLAACFGKGVRVWEVPSGVECFALETHAELAVGVAFHPSRPWLVSCDLTGEVWVWDLDEGGRCHRLHDQGWGVHDLAFHPGGDRLAAACHDGQLLLWEGGDLLRSRPPDRQLDEDSGALWAVTWSHDGQWLATGSERGTVRLRRAGDLQALATLVGDPRRIRSLSFTDDARYLAAGSLDTTSIVWDLETLQHTLAALHLAW